MLIQKPKYRNRIALLILLSYLLISGLNIFHHHYYNFHQRTTFEDSNSLDSQLPINNYSEFECLIYQNLSSLNSITFTSSLHLTLDQNEQELLLVQVEIPPESNFLKSINLRAPPKNLV
jgi:hypothetical protein